MLVRKAVNTETNITPTKMLNTVIARPIALEGVMSPYPTVVEVIIVNQIPSPML